MWQWARDRKTVVVNSPVHSTRDGLHAATQDAITPLMLNVKRRSPIRRELGLAELICDGAAVTAPSSMQDVPRQDGSASGAQDRGSR